MLEGFFFLDVVRTFCIFSFLSILDTLFLPFTHYIYIYIYIYIEVVITFFHLSLHVLFLFSLYAHASYLLYVIFYLCFTLRCLDEFCLKCFRNTSCQSLSCHELSSCKKFSRVCVRIRFYCIQQVSISWMIYDFSHMIICLLWFCHGLPNGKIVRTYVNHVTNICHLELANPLIKRTLFVIG